MTRSRLNKAKHAKSTKNLSASNAHNLFLEVNDDIDRKDGSKITNVHRPTDENFVVNKEYCDSNLLSSSNKIDILKKNIAEIRKGKLNKVTTKTLQLNKTNVNHDLIKGRKKLQMKLEIQSIFVIKLLVTQSLTVIN